MHMCPAPNDPRTAPSFFHACYSSNYTADVKYFFREAWFHEKCEGVPQVTFELKFVICRTVNGEFANMEERLYF